MKLREIISSNELAILELSNNEDEIIAIAKARYKEQKAQKKTLQNQLQKNFKNSIYMEDGAIGSTLRGITTVTNRVVAGADYIAESIGFDLVGDEVTDNMNKMNEMMESKKQTTSRKDLSKERLTELKALDEQGQNAKGVWENVKAGANTMVDTVIHPTEWTTQGVVEMITDPLNLVSFGAGSLAGKLGRTLLQKGIIGASAGTVESVVVNSGAEYIIAKGQNKSDDEANKIAIQSAGGSAVAGGGFGTFGGLVSKISTPLKLERTETSNILDNALLSMNNDKPLTPSEITDIFRNGWENYPKVSAEFRSEIAGVNKYSVHPEVKGKPNFQMLFDNLPVVRATMEKLPAVIKQYVDADIIDVEVGKNINTKAVMMLGHNDILYIGYDNWAEHISADIMDGVHQKNIIDMKKAQDISSKAVEQSKIISQEMISQGADTGTIKDAINQQLTPTKLELQLTTTINDGMPLENRFSGTRLRDMIENSIQSRFQREPQNIKQDLMRSGVSDELSNAVVSSIINKDIDTFDNFVVEKTTANIESTNSALKETITKDIKDANIENQNKDRKDISTSRENGNNENDNTSTSDTGTKPKQDRQETSTGDDSTIPTTIKRDAKSNSSDDGLQSGTKQMERHEATINNGGDNAKPRGNEVVSKQDGDGADFIGQEVKYNNKDYTIDSVDKASGGLPDMITLKPINPYGVDGLKEGKTTIAGKPEDFIVTNENYTLMDKPPVELTKGKRIEVNDAVKEILKKDIATLTDDDKNTLRQYTGTGGLGKGGYGSLTEHYTPYETIKAMYGAIFEAGKKGFSPKEALEPSVGSGNFVGLDSMHMNWTTIDIDKTNHEVVKRLYPKAKNYNMSYESFKGKDFDLIISNVPFLEDRGKGITLGRSDVKALHDYYFVESIDKLRDNGIAAFVTSTGVMDKVDSKIRKEITSKADVIGAFRLPAKTFSKNAHTDVVTDIIFLQKRPDGVKSHLTMSNSAFNKSTKTDDDVSINQYYLENPSSVLGDMKLGVNKMYGTPAYEITGKADYTNMKLNYKKYDETFTGESPKRKIKKDIPTDSQEFKNWAMTYDIEYSRVGENIIIDENGIKVVDKVIKFDDIEDSVKIYKKLTGKSADKIKLLGKIYHLKNIDDIKTYKTNYIVHPLKDKALKKLFRELDSMDKLYEYGALFDDKFNPADSFNVQTKFTNSGTLEITVKSKLHDRLLYNENTQGIININDAQYFANSELVQALKLGYAYVDGNTIANDILYYAGNVYTKLDATQFALDNLPDGDIKNLVEKQHTKLQDTLPTHKIVDEIDFKGTELWISEADIKLFDFEMVTKEIKQKEGGVKKYKKIKSKLGATYDSYLNQDALITARDGESQSSYKRRLKDAKFEVKEVQARLRNDIKSDELLKAKFEDAYNRKMNFYVKPDYSKAQYLIQDVLDELPKHIKLRKNQIEWVIKALYEGKNINAHDVGGGKTMAGIVLARVLKVKGIAKKPLLVVPSKVIKNWEKEIIELFPNSKIISLGGLQKNVREKRLFELSNTNADYILISHEGFKQLKLPDDIEQKYVRDLISENMKNEDLIGRAREIQNQKINLYLDSLSKANANKKITIDKLGIDAIIADEARAFKNVGVNSKLVSNKLGKAFGLNVKEDKDTKKVTVTLDSALAYDFRFKTKYVSSLNNGKNIYLLDATPTPNKPIEVFTMLKHLDDGIFDEYGIKTDRDFAETFFDFGQKLSKKGKFENGIIGIKNAVAFRSILDRYVDRIPMSEFAKRKLIKLPTETTKKEMITASDESMVAFEDIRERLQEAKNDHTKRHEVMGIFSNGVTASVDPRLYERMEFGDLIDPTPDNNKVQRVIELASAKFKSDKKAGQIIFLDSAGHKVLGTENNLHKEIKAELLENGYKKNQVAIINGQTVTGLDGKEVSASGEKASRMKQDIVDAYQSGKIKVVIGSTKSAGEGMNIQTYTTNIYHLDLPWTPAEIIQRNGRGLRHGNKYDNVDVHYFFQEGTFDSLMYSTVMGKKGWNDAIWDAEAKDRIEITDDSGSMPTEAEILIELEINPLIKARMIVILAGEKLEYEYDSIREELNYMKAKIVGARESLQRNNEIIKHSTDSLTDDTPTKDFRLAYEKAYRKSDKQKEYKKKYETDLKDYRDRRKEYIKSRENKTPMYKEAVTKLQDGLKVYEDDFKSIDAQLKEFEAKHYDDKGNIITAFDVKDC